MPTIDARLQRLPATGRPPSELVDALVPALRHATADERNAIADTLVRMRTEDAFLAVLSVTAGQASASFRARLQAEDSPHLRNALRKALYADDLRTQLDALTLIEQRNDLALIEHAAALIDGARDQLPDRAAGAVRSLVLRRMGPRGVARLLPDEQQSIDRALGLLLERAAAHRQHDALLAVALLLRRPGPRVASITADLMHPASMALRKVVAKVDDPIVRRNLLHWLRLAPLDRSVLSRLHQVRGAEAFSDLLDGGHLLLHPARRRAIRQIDRPARCLPVLNDAVHIDERVQHRLPGFIMALPVSTPLRVSRLVEGIAMPSPLARINCANALEKYACAGSSEARLGLQQFTRDRDPFVAATAASRLRSVPGAPDRAVLELIESRLVEHRSIATRATFELAMDSVQGLIDRLDRLDPPVARLAVMTHWRHGREQISTAFEEALIYGNRPLRQRIIALIRSLRLAESFVAALAHCTEDADAHIASAATSAIGDARSLRVQQRLELLAEHEDDRIRANAVEALAGLAHATGRAVECCEDRSNDAHNRVRANAILGLIRTHSPEGMKRLHEMMRDASPMHRLSALWVARRVGAKSLIEIIRAMADGDVSPEMRRRAARAVRLLEQPRARVQRGERLAKAAARPNAMKRREEELLPV